MKLEKYLVAIDEEPAIYQGAVRLIKTWEINIIEELGEGMIVVELNSQQRNGLAQIGSIQVVEPVIESAK